MAKHPVKAAEFIDNQERAHWHDRALWFVREKRDRMAHGLPEWETLRETASQIKFHTMSHLADYLEEFEQNATRRGITVHWARDAKEHNEIVLGILQSHNVRKLVKSKSMLTEECHLNPFLEQQGIEVIDTDLGERIVQLRKEPPSHIVMPAIHLKKQEVGELFEEHLQTEPGNADPNYLTEAARGHLREHFLSADAGLTGVNFAVADTGGFVVCTNEGNADLGTALPKLHIACMGIEKLIPKAEHLGVFTRLLARSATGQPITTYTSHFLGPAPGGELHIVLVDNGRSEFLGSDDFRNSLKCIRCGACMNTCPVYRRSGGFSYETTVPGPIGSILAPLRDASNYSTLPYACSLCGSCSDVCPVKIDLHHELYVWRQKIVEKGLLPWPKRFAMKGAGLLFRSGFAFGLAGKIGRKALSWTPRFLVYNLPRLPVINMLCDWVHQRDLPAPPKQSFREWYRKNRGKR